jgi:SAM-dependent methyltransferase
VDAETVATYDRIAPRFADQWWSTRLTKHMDRFVESVLPGGVVVDLGCGPARDTEWLGELGFVGVGLDASFGMLVEAHRRLGASVMVVRGDLVTLPLRSDGVDGAWMCASLLHLTPAEAAASLADVARVLATGAPLFVSVQAGAGTSKKSSTAGDRRFTFWDEEGLARVVRDAGFDVRLIEAAPADATTGVSWIGLHARSKGKAS